MQGSLIKFHILFHCLLDGGQFIVARGYTELFPRMPLPANPSISIC